MQKELFIVKDNAIIKQLMFLKLLDKLGRKKIVLDEVHHILSIMKQNPG